MMFMSRNLIYGGPQKPFVNRKARVIFFPAPVYRIGCKNVRGWPVGKVWRKRHPGLLFPGLVAHGGLTRVLLPLGHHCVSRSLRSPLDKARACPPPPQALVPQPGGTLRSGRQVAAPARIGVGLRRPALAKRSLTFSRWRSLLSSLAAAGVRFPRSGGGAGARPGPGR